MQNALLGLVHWAAPVQAAPIEMAPTPPSGAVGVGLIQQAFVPADMMK
jgi:hypothetical protein